MRNLAAIVALVPLAMGSVGGRAFAATPQTAPVPAAARAEAGETQRSVSLVIRLRPDQLKKAASELAQMVQGGEAVGLPWLKEAFGAVSAEIVVEDADPSGSTSTAFRASSAGWIGDARDRSRSPVDRDQSGSAPIDEGAGSRPSGPESGYATAAAIIGRHASAIRDSASALIDALPADKAAELREQLRQLGAMAGAIGRSVEGLMPDAGAPRPPDGGPKR